ncbi:MAG: hypothetical protein CMJ18_11415 [Phycisphaeraceae bacterium]|nr:hypothetical protein [Phycisphaeraceae bacterium]
MKIIHARPVVFLISRDDATVDACRNAARRGGLSLHEIASAEDMADAMREARPHLIVVDRQFRERDGESEFVAQMKDDPCTRDVPFIAVSDDLAALVDDESFDDCMRRPVHSDDALFRFRSTLRLHEARMEFTRERHLRGEQARVWTAIFDLSRVLQRSVELDSILEATIAAAADVSCSRRISIMLPDDAGEYLVIAQSVGIPDDVASEVRVPIGEEVAGRVFASQERILDAAHPEPTRDIARYKSEVFACFPLVSTDQDATSRTMGVLNVTDRFGDRAFEPWEMEFIGLLSSIAGSAIHDVFLRRSREETRSAIVIALATLAEYRDNETGFHVDRVTRFSVMLARELQKRSQYASIIDEEFLINLSRSAPLHDIGKVAIPDGILLKPGRLNDAEMGVIRTHAGTGQTAIRSVIERSSDTDFLRMAEDIASTHHEWHDGSGYPNGLRGDQIPLPGRIVAVADVYDAVTSRRVYKPAIPHGKAVEIIAEGRGRQFHPDVIDAFLTIESDFRELAKKLADDEALFLGGGRRDKTPKKKAA